MYIEANKEWFFLNYATKGVNAYFYPKDDFLQSIWNKVLPNCYWINPNRTIHSISERLFVSYNSISIDGLPASFPTSIIISVKFDNLTDEEEIYLSLKYNPIEISEKDSNVSDKD